MTSRRRPARRWWFLPTIVAATLAMLIPLAPSAQASSHREAPLITEDPVADNTDTYAFVSPDRPDSVTLIANWIPLEGPNGGPNFYKFGDDVIYAINVDSDGDSNADVTYEWRFQTNVQNSKTFLYNTGTITSLTDPDFNIRQSYTLTEVRNGVRTVLGANLPTPPVNIGPRSTPNYPALANAAIRNLSPYGIKSFAGQRDEGFYVDLGSVFDLLGLRPFNQAHLIPLPAQNGRDGTKGLNVHSVALQVPKSRLVEGSEPVIGVWSSTYRRRFTARIGSDNAPFAFGDWVQVSRLGMPLVNEVVIPLGKKDVFNASVPANDAQFLPFVQDPEPARLLPVLYPGVNVPTAPRNDLVAVFLTGVPGLNQPKTVKPSEQLRLNTSIPPAPQGSEKTLGVLAGDTAGFPNGRRVMDDTVDIELRVLAGVLVGPPFNGSPNNALSDGVDANDKPYLKAFPYLAHPFDGYSAN